MLVTKYLYIEDGFIVETYVLLFMYMFICELGNIPKYYYFSALGVKF